MYFHGVRAHENHKSAFGDLLEIGFELNKMKVRVTVGLGISHCVSHFG